MISVAEDDGLTDSQRVYFEILEEMYPSPELRRAMEQAKKDLAYQNRKGEAEALARDEPRRRFMRRFRAWLERW